MADAFTPDTHTYACFASSQCTLHAGALEQTWCGPVGLANGAGLFPVETFTLTRLPHLTIPKNIASNTISETTNLGYGSYKRSSLPYNAPLYYYPNAFDADIDSPGASAPPVICLPPNWVASIYIPGASRLRRIVFPEGQDTIGMFLYLSTALELVVVTGGVTKPAPEYWRLGTANVGDNFKLMVPEMVDYGKMIDDEDSEGEWISGDIYRRALTISGQTTLAEHTELIKAPTKYWPDDNDDNSEGGTQNG